LVRSTSRNSIKEADPLEKNEWKGFFSEEEGMISEIRKDERSRVGIEIPTIKEGEIDESFVQVDENRVLMEEIQNARQWEKIRRKEGNEE
jgi:hypothetical protein